MAADERVAPRHGSQRPHVDTAVHWKHGEQQPHRKQSALAGSASPRDTRRKLVGLPHTHTHTHPFNGPLSGTTRVSRYQKGKTNLDFTEARDSEWPLHQLGHMQVCTSLQTHNHASTPPLNFYRPDALPATQPTASKH